jgi:hypothetical protein
MADEKTTTNTLLQRLFKTASITRFIGRYGEQMKRAPFKVYINQLCVDRDTVPERIIRTSGIERTYGHQIFNGRKNPSRDKVIQLAFGFELGYDEAQELLRMARKSTLYPKIERDAVVIYALNKRLSVDDVQATLEELALPTLGKDDKYE